MEDIANIPTISGGLNSNNMENPNYKGYSIGETREGLMVDNSLGPNRLQVRDLKVVAAEVVDPLIENVHNSLC